MLTLKFMEPWRGGWSCYALMIHYFGLKIIYLIDYIFVKLCICQNNSLLVLPHVKKMVYLSHPYVT
jgi:hypothetical protein